MARFLRGMTLGALVGAAIAGSAIWQRARNRSEGLREERREDGPGDRREDAPGQLARTGDQRPIDAEADRSTEGDPPLSARHGATDGLGHRACAVRYHWSRCRFPS